MFGIRALVVLVTQAVSLGTIPLAAAVQADLSPEPQAATPSASERLVIGEWTIAVNETAEVLARAPFGTNATASVSTGAQHPQTNTVHRPFDQITYEKSKALWLQGLQAMRWRLSFRPDHTGDHIAREDASKPPTTSPFRWELTGRDLHLEYPKEKRFKHFTVRVVSTNELHYPMPPLGGYVVLQRTHQAPLH